MCVMLHGVLLNDVLLNYVLLNYVLLNYVLTWLFFQYQHLQVNVGMQIIYICCTDLYVYYSTAGTSVWSRMLDS